MDTITFYSDNKSEWLKIRPTDLILLESADNYVSIHYREKDKVQKKLLRSTLTKMEEQITHPSIFRCHRSYMVNLNQIKQVQGNSRGLQLDLLDSEQNQINIFTRSPREPVRNISYYQWNPSKGEMDIEGLKNCDHIISLAGAGIADKRWTAGRKKEIINSRVLGNELIYTKLQEINHRPSSIVAGSAIGIYGNRGEEKLDENSRAGDDEFLVLSTTLWENALSKLIKQTDQFSLIRIGCLLYTSPSPRDATLSRMPSSA